MRQLKFRIWSKSAESFLHSSLDDMKVENCYEIYGTPRENFFEALDDVQGDNWVVQQWTGLTDKNGIDIYEGDVVQFKPWNSPKKDLEKYLCGSLKKINFGLKYGQFPTAGYVAISLKPADQEEGHQLNYMDQRNMMVVGNVFEDLELFS